MSISSTYKVDKCTLHHVAYCNAHMDRNGFVCTSCLLWNCRNDCTTALVIALIHKAISSACIHILHSCSFEPRRLRHVDHLFKIAMEKSGLHIKLIKLQSILCHQWQQNPNRRVLHDRWEYVNAVNAFSLRVAFHYQSDFVAYSITIERSMFLCKYPLTINRLLSLGKH